jgi:thiamine-phosphate pyrophosphorylase
VRLPDPPVLVITDRRRSRLPLEDVAEAVFAAGCRWLSLREKDLGAADRVALLRRLVKLGARYGATVTVHDDIAAAIAAGAAGVHLPAGASPPSPRRFGRGLLVGCSAHDAAEVAHAAGADYATLSPIFLSASKPGYGPAVGLERLAALAAAAELPLVALGGIDASNAAACVRAGAAGVAVMGAVMAAADPSAVMTGLIKTLRAALAARLGRAP